MLRVCAAIAIVNWILWGAFTIHVGGDALCGEISEGQYLICRHSMSVDPAVPVSRGFWIFSLLYGSFTVAFTPFVIALVLVFSRPRWDRGTFDVVAVSLGLLWVLLIARPALPRWLAWIAA